MCKSFIKKYNFQLSSNGTPTLIIQYITLKVKNEIIIPNTKNGHFVRRNLFIYTSKNKHKWNLLNFHEIANQLLSKIIQILLK